jgi:polysaccharide export outer membrane protein
MNFMGSLRVKIKVVTVSLVVSVLSACTILPGMSFDVGQTLSGESSVSLKPVIKTITPQLIQQERKAVANETQVNMADLTTAWQPYQIGVGDSLSITVWDHPELMSPTASAVTAQVGYTVSSEGKIQFPFAGDIKVEGLTELQARDALIKNLSKFIKNPELTLRIATYRSKRVYLDGEVKLPGIVVIDDIPLTLPEAISRAGGVTALGDQSRISITSMGKTHWVDMSKLIQLGLDPRAIMLKHGDLVRVAPRDESKIFVVGEVNKPGSMLLHNGHMSLNEAMGEAGGVNPNSGAGQIYVIRNANDDQPIVYHLDAQSPVMLALAEGFELKAKDVVYVDAAPMVRLNRVISLILPSAQLYTMSNRGFQ